LIYFGGSFEIKGSKPKCKIVDRGEAEKRNWTVAGNRKQKNVQLLNKHRAEALLTGLSSRTVLVSI